MSATTASGQLESSPARAGTRAGFGHVMLAEWTKIRSVRSTVWSLIIFVVLTIGLTALLSWLTVHAVQTGRAPRRSANLVSDPVSFILETGLGFGQLAICVLGALTMTSEYSTGVIRASLLAVPKRLPVLAAKCAVFAGLILVVGEIVAFCSFFIGRAIVHPVVDVSLSQPGVARAVIGAGLYLTVLGLFALAIGIAHTAQCRRHRGRDRPGARGRPAAGLARQLRLGRARSRLVPHRGGQLHHRRPSAGRSAADPMARLRGVLRVDSVAAGRRGGSTQAPRRLAGTMRPARALA